LDILENDAVGYKEFENISHLVSIILNGNTKLNEYISFSIINHHQKLPNEMT